MTVNFSKFIIMIAVASSISASAFATGLNQDTEFYYHGTDTGTNTSVILQFHATNNAIDPYSQKMVIDKFEVTKDSAICVQNKRDNRGFINTASINIMPYQWSGKYGEVSGNFVSPNTPYGPSTISWQILSQAKCTVGPEKIILIAG